MKCETCEHEIRKSVNFCENCGTTTAGINTDLDFAVKRDERGQKLIFRGLLVLCL
jgi:hypothetical protein